jgi:hypothetical protein
MVRLAATREILDRGFGKARQTVEGEIIHGVSLQLRQLLERHDGQSRSVPSRTIQMIEHDEDDSDRNNNGNGELH